LKNRLHRILNSSMIKIKALVENMEVKDLNRISLKWTRQSAAAQPEYEFGVQNPKRSWAKSTADAEGAYQAGVQKAISEKRFGKGVKKAGDAKWQKTHWKKVQHAGHKESNCPKIHIKLDLLHIVKR